MRAAAAQSSLGSIHLLWNFSWQHVSQGKGLGQHTQEGVSKRNSLLGLLDEGELMVTEDSKIPVSCLQQLLAVAS